LLTPIWIPTVRLIVLNINFIYMSTSTENWSYDIQK
jgi:hypothetical protein